MLFYLYSHYDKFISNKLQGRFFQGRDGGRVTRDQLLFSKETQRKIQRRNCMSDCAGSIGV
jgi:hypothetical protein